MWHYYWSIASRAFLAIPLALGSTWLGILFPVIVCVIGEALGAALFGVAAMKQNLKKIFGIGFASLGVGYTLLFLWCALTTTYQDHQTLAQSNKELATKMSGLVDPASRDAQVADLKRQLAGRTTPSISAVTKELLPVETFASHGLPTTETYVTAHGTISDPTFVLECNSPCTYEYAQSLALTSTLPESKQLSPTRIWVHFVVPAQLTDAQQVAIRVRSESHDPIHTIKVRRGTK